MNVTLIKVICVLLIKKASPLVNDAFSCRLLMGSARRRGTPPKSAKLTRFILLTRKAVLHSS